MGTEISVAARRAYVGSLPTQAHTRSGISFDPRLDQWNYRDGVFNMRLRFDGLTRLSPPLITSLKAVMVWYAENHAPTALRGLFAAALPFFRSVRATSEAPLTAISSLELLNYRSSLTEAIEHRFNPVSVLLRKWHGLGLAGVTDDARLFLKEIRVKSHLTGMAVLTMDPVHGPYSDIEFEGINAALNAAYAADKIDLAPYLLACFVMLLGQRPIQYAALKVCDVSVERSADGACVYMLRVPRAKQRRSLIRSTFTHRFLIPHIGVLLVDYALKVKGQFTHMLPDPLQAPLFPTHVMTQWAPGFEHHCTAEALSQRLTRSMNELRVMSERTGKLLHINSRRFRRTTGTRAAAEGYGELVIAELLDHTDTQSVGVYVQATPAILERIDRAIALQMAPLAQAFAGVLIEDERQATRGDDPRSRILDLRIDSSMTPMGSCGQYGFCELSAPIACYTCMHFQAWLDGPHEAVLAHLLARREHLLTNDDTRVASICDRTILAVADVIRRCDGVRGQGSAREWATHGCARSLQAARRGRRRGSCEAVYRCLSQ
jgi:integrase